MSIKTNIEEKLMVRFAPERLEVLNESHLHAGHRPTEEGDETHMRVRIIAQCFSGLGRVERHRAINDALEAEFKAGLHALAVEAAAPGEPVRW